MRNVVTSAEKLWVRTFKTGYKEVTLAQQSFNPAPCGYEDAEFTRTDLSKAAVAAEVAKAEAAELIAASLSLKEIVEGVSGAMEHGTFRAEKGMRLKDTPEWVAFYVAISQIGAKP